jgi:putative membrane protein
MIPMLAATTILAGWHGHAWWPIFWLLLIALVIFLIGRRGWWGARRGPTAKEILAERYARGEIGADEYRERLTTLK